MNVFGQDVRTPLVAEASGHNVALPGPAGTATYVLTNIPCIHAVYIDVFALSTVRINSIDLLFFSASGVVQHLVNIHTGNIAAGVTSAHRYGGSLVQTAGPPQVGQPIGQMYAIRITNNDAGGAAGQVQVWTAARS